jgi:hypothetical protein
MPRTFHAVLTLFSIRDGFFGSVPEVLAPEKREHRFAVFQFTTLPSMLAQDATGLYWFVFIDSALPSHYRERLEALVGARPNTHLVVRDFEQSYRTLEWMIPYFPSPPEVVLTTVMDDDDGVRVDYMRHLRGRVEEDFTSDGAPGIRFYGSQNALQWDLTPDSGALLGHVKPWVCRDFLRRPYPVSAGFSVAVQYPGFDTTVIGFAHSQALNACRINESFDDAPQSTRRGFRGFRGFRKRVGDAAQRGGETWDGQRSLEQNYRACSLAGLHSVMVNHGLNLQVKRIEEARDKTAPATPQSFPGVPFDYDCARDYLRVLMTRAG